MYGDYVKHLFIRTPLEAPALWLRRILRRRRSVNIGNSQERSLGKQFMKRVLHPSSNCIDIGCHLGSALAEIVRLAPEGNHMAFEPVPRKFAWLKKKFPEVDVRQLALRDQPGLATFFHNVSSSGFSSLR